MVQIWPWLALVPQVSEYAKLEGLWTTQRFRAWGVVESGSSVFPRGLPRTVVLAVGPRDLTHFWPLASGKGFC